MDYDIYRQQLQQINLALESCPESSEKEELISLKASILELLELTGEGCSIDTKASNANDDEYARFMAEIEREGALPTETQTQLSADEVKALEGKKCRAPHKHHWGDIVYHNAMICSLEISDSTVDRELRVRVLFTNPTHKEMLPCPYYFENECKFSEEKCRFSHGELVLYSSLQEYIEPNFDNVVKGCTVLAKQTDNLWYRAIVKSVYDKKCLVKLESNQKTSEVLLEHVLPLTMECEMHSDTLTSDEENDVNTIEEDEEDIINNSLLTMPTEALGEWEKYTKGIGSKLMQKMGYITGTGLGKKCDGRVDPVTAVILPSGKSLDHCMMLRENAGGDKNLFNAERKLKQMQRKQEIQNQKAYERENQRVDVFNFLNNTLSNSSNKEPNKSNHRHQINKETTRNLNVASLQISENIRRVERDLDQIEESLTRHTDVRSNMHKNLKNKLHSKKNELKSLQMQATNIITEQSLRNDKKKMTIF